MAADAGVLSAADVIRRDLAGQVDRQGAVDADEAPELPHQRRVVDGADRKHPHVGARAEPIVERRAAEGERADRHAVVEALAVRHLAGRVQPHHPIGDHLRMDPEVAARAAGEEPRHLVRDGADTELEGRAVVHEGGDVAGDRQLGRRRRPRRERDELRGVIHPAVDLGEVHAVPSELGQAVDARHVHVHLGQREAVRIPRHLEEWPVRCRGGDAEAEPSLAVGRRRDGHHDPRPHAEAEPLESVEVDRQILHARALCPCGALDRAEEAAQDADGRVPEHGMGVDEQAREDRQVLEVGPRADRVEQPDGLSRRESARDRIMRTYEPRRLRQLETAPLTGHGRARRLRAGTSRAPTSSPRRRRASPRSPRAWHRGGARGAPRRTVSRGSAARRPATRGARRRRGCARRVPRNRASTSVPRRWARVTSWPSARCWRVARNAPASLRTRAMTFAPSFSRRSSAWRSGRNGPLVRRLRRAAIRCPPLYPLEERRAQALARCGAKGRRWPS